MQSVIRVPVLPDGALEAAQEFAENWTPQIRRQLRAGENVIVTLPLAAYDHQDWRRGLVRDLARAHSPSRVNFVAGRDSRGLSDTIAFLENSPGITGQYLVAGNEG